MINIRQNTFETNSSSVHSLVVFHENWESAYNYTYDKEMTIKGGMYDRCYPKVLATLQDKLSYIWTAIISLYCDYNYETKQIIPEDSYFYWKKVLQKIVPNVIFIFPEFRDSIWIDHCGALGNFFDECKENNQIMKDLILEDNSFIIVEGDEYCMMIAAFYPDYWTNEEKLVKLNNNYKIYVKGC